MPRRRGPPSRPARGAGVGVRSGWPGGAVNGAPAGSPEAVGGVMPSPSGSFAVTVSVNGASARAFAAAGAVTTGGCGWANALTVVARVPPGAFAAWKGTT